MKHLPKAELHLHLEDFIVSGQIDVKNLVEFCAAFRSAQDSIRAVEDFCGVFLNLGEYLGSNGIVYAEVFFSPSRYLRSGWNYKDVVLFFEEQISLLKKERGIIVKLLVDVSRTYGAALAGETLDMVIETPCECIIGIGLGGDETRWEIREYSCLFEKARKAGLKTVAHAGESVGSSDVYEAVEFLKAARIGHATAAAQNESTLELLIKKQIPIEVAVTSNVITGHFVQSVENHPIKTFFERGALVTLNTDDPTFFNTSLINELWLLHTRLGFSLFDLYKIIINSFKASFMPEAEKQTMIKLVNKRFKRCLQFEDRCKHTWKSVKSAFEELN